MQRRFLPADARHLLKKWCLPLLSACWTAWRTAAGSERRCGPARIGFRRCGPLGLEVPTASLPHAKARRRHDEADPADPAGGEYRCRRLDRKIHRAGRRANGATKPRASNASLYLFDSPAITDNARDRLADALGERSDIDRRYWKQDGGKWPCRGLSCYFRLFAFHESRYMEKENKGAGWTI